MRDIQTHAARRPALLRVSAAVLAGGVLGVAIFLWLGPSGDPAAEPGGPGVAAAPTPRESQTGTPDPSTPTSPAPAPAESADPGSAPGSDPDAPATQTPAPRAPFTNSPGIEAAPEPTPDPGAQPGPDPTPSAPGAVGPLPALPEVPVPTVPEAPESAVDALVDGFPVDVLPLPSGSAVLSSSVSGDGGRMLATVETTDPADPAAVLQRWTDHLVGLGFTWGEAPATDGTTARSFLRDGHVVVVSVRPQADGSLVRVVGILAEKS